MVSKFSIWLLILMVLPLFVASGLAVTYKQNTDIDLVHSVRLRDAPTTTALCNITVINSEEQIIVPFLAMTYNSPSQTFNFTLNQTQTNNFGDYTYDITCIDSGFNKTETFNFFVNQAGRDLKTSDSLLYGIMFLILAGLFGLTLFGAFRIPFKNSRDFEGKLLSINYAKHAKLGCIALAYVFFSSITYVAYNFSLGFIELGALSNIFNILQRFAVSFVFPVLVISIAFIVIVLINDLKLDKQMTARGFFKVDEI